MFRFDQEIGKPIHQFGSTFTMSRIGLFDSTLHIGCMHLDNNGLIGRHEAVTDQLFLVIEGSGWVSGDSGEVIEIKAGQAAFWTKGESHEAGTYSTTMKAIVIEGDNLQPEKFMGS